MWGDLTFGLRVLRRHLSFSVTVVLVLSIGIGGSVAICDVAEEVFLRPLPFPQAERLVWVEADRSRGNGAHIGFHEFSEVIQHVDAFESVSASGGGFMRLTGGQEPLEAQVEFSSASTFQLCGAAPALGRLFTNAEDSGVGEPVAVLSASLWHHNFGSAKDVIGRPVVLNGTEYRIVGVVAEPFHGPLMLNRTAIWLPLARLKSEMPNASALNVVARIRSGLSLRAARAQLDGLSLSQTAIEQGRPWGVSLVITPLQEFILGDVRHDLRSLLAAVILMFVVGCANVANLLINRAVIRSREWAVRIALGCGRAGLIRQCFSESLTLALVAGIIGVALAAFLVKLIRSFGPELRGIGDFRPDGSLAIIAIAISLLSCLLFGILPTLYIASTDYHQWLRAGRFLTILPNVARLQHKLLVFEIGVSLALLTFASSITTKYITLSPSRGGFHTDALVAVIVLDRHVYETPESQRKYVDSCLYGLRNLPGVRRVASTSILPMSGMTTTTSITMGDQSFESSVHTRSISPEYFEMMGIPIRAGRGFSSQDTISAPSVAIVNETSARRYWPNGSPLGSNVRLGAGTDAKTWQIVGVVADIRPMPLSTKTWAEIYVPLAQSPSSRINLLVESTQPPQMLAGATRGVLRNVDPDQPALEISPFWAIIDRAYSPVRYRLWLIVAFSVAVLIMTCIGVYGVVSNAQQQRQYEIGVRMALGAQTGSVFLLVSRRALASLCGGLVFGCLLAWSSFRVIGSNVYYLGQPNLGLLWFAMLVIIITVVLAAAIPTIQVIRKSPLDTLRHSE